MRRRLLIACGLVAVVCHGHSALAHELRPAYLHLTETAPDTYELTWKVPART